MKRQLLFGLGITLLIIGPSYPLSATTIDINYLPGTETFPSVNTASAVVNCSLQPHCLIPGDNHPSNQRITVHAEDFPLDDVSLPIESSQPLAFPGAPVLLISGLVGLAFYRKGQPKPKS
jgi:hypothetical protein